jgi:hypothetical protein
MKPLTPFAMPPCRLLPRMLLVSVLPLLSACEMLKAETTQPRLDPKKLPNQECSVFLPYSKGPISEVEPVEARAHIAGSNAAYAVYCPDKKGTR